MIGYSKRDFLKHMPDVKKYDEYISALNEKWENLKLLCEISCPTHSKNILPAMGEIQGGFSDLQKKLTETLISETVNKMEQKVVSKAQVAIDILIRNLYERTADVGFLSTDDDIKRFAGLRPRDEAARAVIIGRLREYVAKYSVYEDIIILSPAGEVLANLDADNPILGKRLSDPVLDCTLQTKGDFCEFFQPSVLQRAKKNAHIFSHQIVEESTGEVLGLLCLCFRFDNEMEQIFKKLSTDYDGSVITIVDSANKVLASSDKSHVAPGATVEGCGAGAYEIVYYRGQEYIARTVSTQGYQNYHGLGWKGHIMIPLGLAFREKAVLDGVDKTALDSLMSRTDSLSDALNDIIKQTQAITRSLKWIVYNGQIIARGVDTDGESRTLKPVLNAISKVGVQTGALFESSVQNLFATLISTDLVNARFMASLCVDIMDRNLYERADDCRWWAMNPTFRALLSDPDGISEKARTRLTDILSKIHSLYTVYSNLFLFDHAGTIVAVSNPQDASLLGQTLKEPYIQNTLSNCRAEKYFVSPFAATGLYGGGHTYIYSASITDAASPNRTVGGVGIVFDSALQFSAMLEDGINKTPECFAVFTDRGGNIISSTRPEQVIGTRITVPEPMLLTPNGRSSSEIMLYHGEYFAIGCACSSGYREYKSCDGYQNDVLAFVFKKLADDEAVDRRRVPAATVEQSDITLSPREAHRMIVTFSVGGQLFGVEQDSVLEVVDSSKAFPFHAGAHMVHAAVPYKGGYLSVVSVREMFRLNMRPDDQPYLLIVGAGGAAQIALEVDDLNQVLEINVSDVKEAPSMGSIQSCLSGVVCLQSSADSQFLFLLDHEVLLSPRRFSEILTLLACEQNQPGI